MSPTASDIDTLHALEADTRQAWSNYSVRLRDLTGEEYEREEAASWDELQAELARLERRRERLEAPTV